MYKIMDMFFEDTQESHNIREVARLARIAPMTARKKLKELHQKELLKEEKTKLTIEYKASNNELFNIELKHYYIKKLHEIGLINYLNKELNQPRVIYLFGSITKGNVIKKSDVDLYMLSSEKKELTLESFEKKLKRKINLIIQNKKEFNKAKEQNPELLNNVLNGVKLSGYLEVY